MDVPAALCHQQTTAPTMTSSNSRGEERRKTEDGRLTHSRPHRTRPTAPYPRLDAAPRAASYPRLVVVGALGAQLGVALRGFSNVNGYRRGRRRKKMKEGEEETHHLRELVVKRALPVPTNDTLEELRGRDAGRPPCGDEFACTP
jgi:hypothetical protein